MSFQRYPKYKESGLAWLGEIPEHWQTGQSRRRFQLRKDRAHPDDRQLTASQKHGVIYQDEFMALEGQKVMQVFTGADILKHAEPNDFVISMRSFQGGIEWCGLSGSISSAYVMLIPDGTVHPDYFRYLFKSASYIQALQSTTNLVRDGQALRYDNFTQIDLPQIPISEQVQIAKFLNAETSKIDALIAEQQRLIERLKEKRQAVISHAVTKGLKPNAPMKDSGIQWIGEIPAHWKVHRLKHVATIQTGLAKGKDYLGVATKSVPYLRVANVQNGYLNLDELALMDIPESCIEAFSLKPGDVLMNEGGDFDKLGRGCVWRGEVNPCVHQNHVFAVRPQAITSEWLNEVTGSDYAQFYFMSRSKQSTNLASISSTNLMELPILAPPPDETEAILTHLSQIKSKLDILHVEGQNSIALLQERRTALISAAVTGKIDVRNYSPQVPHP